MPPQAAEFRVSLLDTSRALVVVDVNLSGLGASRQGSQKPRPSFTHDPAKGKAIPKTRVLSTLGHRSATFCNAIRVSPCAAQRVSLAGVGVTLPGYRYYGLVVHGLAVIPNDIQNTSAYVAGVRHLVSE